MFVRINDRITSVGAKDYGSKFFDRLMPTPLGTTYNSYIIKGEKVCLIDPVKPESSKDLLQNLDKAGVGKLDYLVCLHTEQDHSGGWRDVVDRYPGVELVATDRVASLMALHHNIAKDMFRIMAPESVLDLGGLTLKFHPIPFAHWPDNTVVTVVEDNIMITSDLFGAHFIPEDVNKVDVDMHLEEAKGYFAEIMMPTRKQVRKHVLWAREQNPAMILPAHGPAWKNPSVIIDAYDEWTSDIVKPRVIIPFVSMHESTRIMVRHLVEKLESLGVEVKAHDLGDDEHDLRNNAGSAIYDMVDAAIVVLATPTVLTAPHPCAAFGALLMNALKIKAKYLGLMGSFGWGTQVVKIIESLTSAITAERLEPVLIKGLPNEEELGQIDALADTIAAKLAEL